MNSVHPSNTGHSNSEKMAYANTYLTHVPIKNQRSIGVTEETLEKIKDVVQLVALNATTNRAFVSAVITEHLKEYKFIHEFMRRFAYNRLLTGDLEKFLSSYDEYAATYLAPNSENHNTAWVRVDTECVEAMKQIVSWQGNGATIGSFADAIIKAHLAKYDSLLGDMKSDVFNCQP